MIVEFSPRTRPLVKGLIMLLEGPKSKRELGLNNPRILNRFAINFRGEDGWKWRLSPQGRNMALMLYKLVNGRDWDDSVRA